MKKIIFLLITIGVSTAVTINGCLSSKIATGLFMQRTFLLSRTYSTEPRTPIKRHRYVVINKEPGIKENPAYPFKDFILSKSEFSAPNSSLEKILNKKDDLDKSFRKELEDELSRIHEKNNE